MPESSSNSNEYTSCWYEYCCKRIRLGSAAVCACSSSSELNTMHLFVNVAGRMGMAVGAAGLWRRVKSITCSSVSVNPKSLHTSSSLIPGHYASWYLTSPTTCTNAFRLIGTNFFELRFPEDSPVCARGHGRTRAAHPSMMISWAQTVPACGRVFLVVFEMGKKPKRKSLQREDEPSSPVIRSSLSSGSDIQSPRIETVDAFKSSIENWLRSKSAHSYL